MGTARIGACVLLAMLALPGTSRAQGKAFLADSLAARAAADSNEPAAHYALAQALLERKRWNAADTALARVVQLDPQRLASRQPAPHAHPGIPSTTRSPTSEVE